MASPQQSITTVNGRRCTRSRVRTAAVFTSTADEPAIVAPTQVATSQTPDLVQQILPTDAVQAAPPAASTNVVEQPAAAPTTDRAVTSATGTTTTALPIPSGPGIPLAILAPSAPAAEGNQQPSSEDNGLQEAEQTQAPAATSASPPDILPSNPVLTAIPTLSTISSLIPPFTAPAASDLISFPDASPADPTAAPDIGIITSSIDPDVANQPPTTTAMPALPSGNSAGIIAPDNADDGPLTLPNPSQGNIASIVGGVIGGVACLALISGLFFYCLRKRKTMHVPKWIEKRDLERPAFVEKVKEVPEVVGAFFAKVKGYKAGPTRNPYRRQDVHTSVSSVYSNSGPQALGAQRRGSVRSFSSKKSERNVLRKKNSISSNYRFPGPSDEPSPSNGNNINNNPLLNPFADPEPQKSLQLLNPDPRSTVGPVTPAPTAQPAKDPFASILDDLVDMPAWMQSPPPAASHARAQSSTAPPRPHPPSSVYTSYIGPAPDTDVPPLPSQAAQPNQKRRSSFAFPAFDLTTAGSRDSQYTMFGEPGPSRPGTSLFAPPSGRTVRQSDPFDLDRPEVLGFGNVLGRKEVRASVTRQGSTRNKRTSSVPGYINAADGPYAFEKGQCKTVSTTVWEH